MSNSTTKILSLGLFILFVAALALSLVAGVRSYSSIIKVDDGAKEHLIANAAIANTIHSMDSFDAITEGRFEGGKALVIKENTDAGVFENRIYSWKGDIILESAPAQDPYTPARGVRLFSSNIFDFTIDGQLITIKTSEGTTNIALRSDVSTEVR